MTVFHPRAVPSSGISIASSSDRFTAAVAAAWADTVGKDVAAEGRDKYTASWRRMAKASSEGARSGAPIKLGMTAASDSVHARRATLLTVESLDNYSHFLRRQAGTLTPF